MNGDADVAFINLSGHLIQPGYGCTGTRRFHHAPFEARHRTVHACSAPWTHALRIGVTREADAITWYDRRAREVVQDGRSVVPMAVD